MNRLFLITCCLSTLCGCQLLLAMSSVDVPAKAYNIDTGDTFAVTFRWDGNGYGQAWGTTEKGIRCSGEYVTQMGGHSGSSVSTSQGWGSIYGWGASGFASIGGVSVGSYSVQPNTQIGSVTLSCDDKNIIQCEYVVNRNNHGSGFCKDNRKSRYKFTF